jgi:hypothetical protein
VKDYRPPRFFAYRAMEVPPIGSQARCHWEIGTRLIKTVPPVGLLATSKWPFSFSALRRRLVSPNPPLPLLSTLRPLSVPGSWQYASLALS